MKIDYGINKKYIDDKIAALSTLVNFKPGVANAAALPLVGNVKQDARITGDDGHLYIWDGANWIDQGDILELSWSDIENKPSSAVANIDDAVGKRHSPNTDTYLATQVTKVLYVDGNRIDTYAANGSITKPFLTIQAAINAASAGYRIEILPGIYNETITIDKTLIFRGDRKTSRITGTITINTANVAFIGLDIRSTVTMSRANHFAVDVYDCSIDTGAWNITATAPVGDEWLQIFNSWHFSNLNITNVCTFLQNCFIATVVVDGGTAYLVGGDVSYGTITLQNASTVFVIAENTEATTINVGAGTTLNIDADSAGQATINNLGTLNLLTSASNVNNKVEALPEAIDKFKLDKYFKIIIKWLWIKLKQLLQLVAKKITKKK